MEAAVCLNVDTLLSDFSEDRTPTKEAKFQNSVLTGDRTAQLRRRPLQGQVIPRSHNTALLQP